VIVLIKLISNTIESIKPFCSWNIRSDRRDLACVMLFLHKALQSMRED